MTDGWGDASGIEGNYAEDSPESGSEGSGAESESKTNETRETKPNIKDEWNGRTIYVPDQLLDELEDTYLESQLKLRNAGRDEFKKSRHFYPLVVQLGLEALSETDADEIQTRLDAIRND